MKNQSLKNIPPTKSNIVSSDLVKICNNVTTRSQSCRSPTSQLIPTARKPPGDRKNLKKEKSQNMNHANISTNRPSVLNCPICNVTIGTFSFRLLSLHLKLWHKNMKSEKININGMLGYFDCDDCMIPHHSSEFCTTINGGQSLNLPTDLTRYDNPNEPGFPENRISSKMAGNMDTEGLLDHSEDAKQQKGAGDIMGNSYAHQATRVACGNTLVHDPTSPVITSQPPSPTISLHGQKRDQESNLMHQQSAGGDNLLMADKSVTTGTTPPLKTTYIGNHSSSPSVTTQGSYNIKKRLMAQKHDLEHIDNLAISSHDPNLSFEDAHPHGGTTPPPLSNENLQKQTNNCGNRDLP